MKIGRVMISWSPTGHSYSDYQKLEIEGDFLRITNGEECRVVPLSECVDEKGDLRITVPKECRG